MAHKYNGESRKKFLVNSQSVLRNSFHNTCSVFMFFCSFRRRKRTKEKVTTIAKANTTSHFFQEKINGDSSAPIMLNYKSTFFSHLRVRRANSVFVIFFYPQSFMFQKIIPVKEMKFKTVFLSLWIGTLLCTQSVYFTVIYYYICTKILMCSIFPFIAL